jgi:hypothetical protein
MIYAIRFSETGRYVAARHLTSVSPSEAKFYKTARRAEYEAGFISASYPNSPSMEIVRFELNERECNGV